MHLTNMFFLFFSTISLVQKNSLISKNKKFLNHILYICLTLFIILFLSYFNNFLLKIMSFTNKTIFFLIERVLFF